MSDPYDLTSATRDSPRTPSPAASAGGPSSAAWIVLVVGATGNMVASAGGAPVAVHLLLGVLTAAAVAVLVAQRLRPRASR